MVPPRFADVFALYKHIRHIDERDQRKQYLRDFDKQLLLVCKEIHQHTLPLAILDQQLQKYQECEAIHKKEDSDAFQFAEEIGLIHGSTELAQYKLLLAHWQKLEDGEKMTTLSQIT